MTKYHLIMKPGGWTLYKEEQADVIQNYRGHDKQEALLLASELIKSFHKPSRLIVHNERGEIEQEREYPESAIMAA